MKKLIILLVVLIFAGILGFGGYTLLNNKGDQSTEEQLAQVVEESESGDVLGEKFSGSFLQLLALGQDYTCTFDTTDDAGNRTYGTVYVADGGKKMNGEFMMSQSEGEMVSGNVIRDGNMQYTWTSLAPEGFKSTITEDDSQGFFGGSESDDSTSVGLDDNVDFDCSPWRIDNTMFVPPTDINFVDINAQMQELQETTEQVQSVQCSACDQAPAGAREQCLQALGCN